MTFSVTLDRAAITLTTASRRCVGKVCLGYSLMMFFSVMGSLLNSCNLNTSSLAFTGVVFVISSVSLSQASSRSALPTPSLNGSGLSLPSAHHVL